MGIKYSYTPQFTAGYLYVGIVNYLKDYLPNGRRNAERSLHTRSRRKIFPFSCRVPY